MYLAATQLFNKKVGLVSALLIAISPVNILYSQEIRSYVMLTTLTILSFYLFIKILKDPKHTSINYLLLAVLNAISFATHYFGIITIILQNTIFYFFWKKKKFPLKKWFYAQLPTLLVILAYAKIIISHISILHIGLKPQLVGVLNLPTSLANLGLIAFSIPIIALIMFTLIISFKSKEIITFYKRHNWSLFLLIFTGIFGVIYLIHMKTFIVPSFVNRYPLFLLPIAYIFFSKMLVDLKKGTRTTILILLILLSAFVLFNYYTTETKADWKNASNFLIQNTKEGEVSLFDKVIAPFQFYYYQGDAIIHRMPALTDKEGEGMAAFNTIKKNDLDNSTGIWLVVSKNYRNEGLSREILKANYQEDLEKEFYRIKIYHYSQKQ